jgi:hypothetical protein
MLICALFAFALTDGAVAHVVSDRSRSYTDAGAGELLMFWGTLFTSMDSLLRCALGGYDWAEPVAPLMQLNPIYPAMFYVYIIFYMFAVMNLVTAVFVDTTMQRSRTDRDFVIQTERAAKQDYIQHMVDIFHDLDKDGSGTVSLDELQDLLEESEDLMTYFSALDLDVTKVSVLFSLMDTDGNGEIDQDEFLWGCMHLRGEAKTLDVAMLNLEMKSISRLLELMAEAWDEQFGDEDNEPLAMHAAVVQANTNLARSMYPVPGSTDQ